MALHARAAVFAACAVLALATRVLPAWAQAPAASAGQGNGAASAAALTDGGGVWAVETIAGAAPLAGTHVSLTFAAPGRLSGRASCNSYGGSYEASGQSLKLLPGDAAMTMMACAPAAMRQEESFLALLKAVQRFELARDGALILRTSDGRTIIARRAADRGR